MDQRPQLQLYVTRGCGACNRAEHTLRTCERLARIVDLSVLVLGEEGVRQPGLVIGGPTTVFQGAVMALGTPDCEDLAERIESLISARG